MQDLNLFKTKILAYHCWLNKYNEVEYEPIKFIYVTEGSKYIINPVITKLFESDVITVDIETNGLDFTKDKILSICVGNNSEAILFVDSYDVLSDLFKDQKVVGHNFIFDYCFIKYVLGIEINNIHDTMITEKVHSNGLTRNYGLASLVKQYFKVTLDKGDRRIFEGIQEFPHTEQAIVYAAKDVFYTHMLYEEQIKRKFKYDVLNEKIWKVVDLENKCVCVYGDMQINGMYIDKDYWQCEVVQYYTEQDIKILDYLDQLVLSDNRLSMFHPIGIQPSFFDTTIKYYVNNKKEAQTRPVSINWDSSLDKQKLFKLLGITLKAEDHKTKEIKNSSSKESLLPYALNLNYNTITWEETKELLKDKDIVTKFATCLLLHNKFAKFTSTYGEKFIKLLDDNSILRANYWQMGTSTGRVSSNKPNLQNIPAIGRFRHGFKSRWNNVVITSDLSGAELRILADSSADPIMLQAFIEGKDVHGEMARIMHGIGPEKELPSELRKQQKTINFGLAYGAGPKKFAPVFGSEEKAKKMVDLFFNKFPSIKKYLEDSANLGTKNKFAITEYGRPRFFEFNIEAWKIKNEAKNHPIQGGNADIIKLASINIREKLRNFKSLLCNQVHDEIVVDVHPDDNPEELKTLIEICMKEASEQIYTKVPMVVESHIEPYWTK